MSPWVQQIFGLDPFVPGEAGVRFGFAVGVPGWAWALAGIIAALIAGWSYRKLTGSRGGRIALGVLRTLTLLTIVVLAAGPQLVRQPERVERDWVVVMADRSRSMTIADVAGADSSAPRTTRETQLQRTLSQSRAALDKITEERNVLWLGFDAGAFPLASTRGIDGTSVNLGPVEGRRTALGRSLEQALQQVAARPVSGIVILSDGRSFDQPSRAVLRRLEGEQIPVFTVPLGSAEMMGDFAVAKAEAPNVAFLNDVVPVNVEIQRSGGTGPMAAKVQLVDDSTGLVLDERRLDVEQAAASPPTEQPTTDKASSDKPADAGSVRDRLSLTLSARPDHAGKSNWTVRLVPDDPDLSPENNAAGIAIELVDRPIRVVYFDGYPRWEYRYLKSLLVRERSVRSAVMLLSADKQFLQDGSEPLAALPTSPGDWASIDVVVLGDVRAELFSDEQLAQLRDHVALKGGGLIWIGGSGATPGSYRGRALADLLPFMPDASDPSRAGAVGDVGVSIWDAPILARPAQAARTLGLLALGESPTSGWPAELSNPDMGWSLLRWVQRIAPRQLKPSAEVLATAVPADRPNGEADATPLVMSMRFGAGRVVYIASDEIWRWRFGRGETLFERFWLPLLRFAARESLSRTGKSAMLEADPDRALIDQPVRITVKLVDQALIDSRGPSSTISARIIAKRGASAAGGADRAPIAMTLTRENAGVFAGTFLPPEPGDYSVELTDPLLAGLGLTTVIDVAAPDDEMRSPQTDHAALAALSKATGGKVLTPASLSDLPELLPNRQLRLLGTPEIRTLWDRPIVLVFLIVLLGVEWLGRKWLRLA